MSRAKNTRTNKCKFCKKGFSSEKTLFSHMCPKKKRFADKDMVAQRIGFRTFQRFYQLTTISKQAKEEMDFIDSKYYLDFVKFGRHIGMLDPIYPDLFIDFVIKNSVKLKDWCKDHVYDTYLEDVVKKEKPEKALERSIVTMVKWSKEEDRDYFDFFEHVTNPEAIHLIRSGKISPWVLYLAESAEKLWGRLSNEELAIIDHIIDPTKWNAKIIKSKEDARFVQTMLKEANL